MEQPAPTSTTSNQADNSSPPDYLTKFVSLFRNKYRRDASGHYVCLLCEEVRETEESAFRHFMVHTEEKPYVCSVCLTAFETKARLERHTAERHANNAQPSGSNMERNSNSVNKVEERQQNAPESGGDSVVEIDSENVVESTSAGRPETGRHHSTSAEVTAVVKAEPSGIDALVLSNKDLTNGFEVPDGCVLIKVEPDSECYSYIPDTTGDGDEEDSAPYDDDDDGHGDGGNKNILVNVDEMRFVIRGGNCRSSKRDGKVEKKSKRGAAAATGKSKRQSLLQKTRRSLRVRDRTKDTDVVLPSQNEQEPSVKIFTCSKCDFESYLEENLLLHLKKHQEGVVRSFKCDCCSYVSYSQANVKVHKKKHKRGKQYVCSECTFTTDTAKNLRKHNRRHTGEKPYDCTSCSQSFRQLGALKVHLRSHTGEKIQCRFCPADFSDVKSLKKHMVSHMVVERETASKSDDADKKETVVKIEDVLQLDAANNNNSELEEAIVVKLEGEEVGEEGAEGERPPSVKERPLDVLRIRRKKKKKLFSKRGATNGYRLSKCVKSGRNLFDYARYEKVAADGSIYYACELCSYSNPIKHLLYGHLKIHTMDRVFKCQSCPFAARTKNRLIDHNFRHSGEKPLSCEICGMNFARKCSLKQHSVVHKDEKPYACDFEQCTYACNRKGNLRMHKEQVHKIMPEKGYSSYTQAVRKRQESVSCPSCSYVSTSKPKMAKHLVTHSDERPFECVHPGCTYKAKTDTSLKQHNRMIHSNTLFSCTKCDFKTYTESNLTTHLHKHDNGGVDIFQCEHCVYSSYRLANLRTHLQTHTGEKSYSCDTCAFSTSRPGNLRRHIRTHTGEKPYHCSVCTLSFIQSGSLKVHMRTHTGERPYRCSVCPSAFSENGTLKKHMLSHNTGGELRSFSRISESVYM